jgi:hypothetical protein
MKHRRGRRHALGALFGVAGALAYVSAARAQVPGEEIARRAFEEGVALEKKGDFAGALSKFKESEQIKATLGNRYHKAYCLEMTGKLTAAMIEYEGVDKAAREANKAELVEAARIRLEPLRTKVPQLSLKLATAAPKDAQVALDGAPISPALLDGKGFRVDPGEHVITASAPDHEGFTKRIATAESTTTSVEITLQATSAKPVSAGKAGVDPSNTPPAEPSRERSRVLPIATTAGAVVLAGGGFVAYLLAGREQDDLKKACSTSTSCDDDKGATRTLDALALGSWIGAAGLAALSVVLWTSPSTTSPTSAHARLSVRSSWLGLEGRF